MERHFILPITIAAALHAGLLFGIRSHSIELPPPIKTIVKWLPADPLPPEMIPPPPESRDEEAVATKGAPGDPPPTQPDRPEPLTPDRFPVEISRQDPAVNVDIKTMIAGSHGDPDAPDTVPGIGPGLLRIGDLDGVPRARSQAAPTYPFEAKSRGLSGEVLVEFSVDENGAVYEPRVVRSTDRIFEEAAVRAVARWKFEPGRRDGRIVRFKMTVPIVFRLDEN